MKKLLLLSLFILSMQAVVAQAPKKVLIEDFTGTWCGFCPLATSYIDQAKVNSPGSIIDVAIHGPNPASDTMSNEFAYFITGAITAQNGNNIYHYPGTMVDRVKWKPADKVPQLIGLNGNIANNDIVNNAYDRTFVTSPVSISIHSTYNSSNRHASVTVDVDFVASVSGDLRINCYLVEDSVIGNSAFNQSNYYGNHCSSPYSFCSWYNYPCVVATSVSGTHPFVHRNVVRYSMPFPYTDWTVQPPYDKIWGSTGITSSVSSGDHFNKIYNYDLPAEWNANQMKVVAFVSHYSAADTIGGEVLNVEEVRLGNAVGVHENPSAIDKVTLDAAYPNPFSEITRMNLNIPATQHVTVKIYDILGNEVTTLVTETLSPGDHSIYWNGKSRDGAALSNGIYLVKVQTEKQSLTKSVILSRY